MTEYNSSKQGSNDLPHFGCKIEKSHHVPACVLAGYNMQGQNFSDG